MLQSIVLKNFVHFMDRTVIALNNSQRGQPEGQPINANEDKTPTDKESGQTERLTSSTGADKTPTDSLERERVQKEGQSSSIGAHKTHTDSKAIDTSQEKQAEGHLTNTCEDSTPRDSVALDSTGSKYLDIKRGQKDEPSTSTGAFETRMDSKSLDKKTTTTDSNALNFFVGANFCGKSTVLELIRRCMTDEINASVTRPYEETMVAYAFCKFYLPKHGEIISGIIRDPDMNIMFKVFIYKNRTLVRSKSSDSETTRSFSLKEKEGEEVFELIFNKTSDEKGDEKVKDILGKIKQSSEESSSNEPNWKSLEDKFIATFPLRGIGSVQWTRSERIGEKYKEKNYKKAIKRAEIISTLMLQLDDTERTNETRIFNFLTYPEVFKFEKIKGTIQVQHNGRPFDLLKTSEGIIEAKVNSLLLALKDIKTLCLEDPDRGMHPQMIERLKSVLYESAHHKTIIVVTHSPYLIDSLTINGTHVFVRNRLYGPYVCSVLDVGDNSDLLKVADIETARILLFATKVLLVEGALDREVVQTILTQDKCIELEKSRSSENNEEVNIDYFTKNISTHQIISICGCDNVDKVLTFCENINLPCLCLLDRDKVKTHFKENGKFWGKRKDKDYIEKLEKDLSTDWPEGDYMKIEALKSMRKETTDQNTHRTLNEIISFRLKEKRDKDLKKFIESLELRVDIENPVDLRCKPFETYLQCFQSKTNCKKQQKQEKEYLKTIAMYWLEQKKEEEFDSYIDNLNTKYFGKQNSFEFWRKKSKECEEYLMKLESNRKTFVWRNGALEDAILSSDNYYKILRLLTSTDTPSGSRKGINKSKQKKDKRRQRVGAAKELLKQVGENTTEQPCYNSDSTAQNKSENTAATGGESSEKGLYKKTKPKDEMSQKSNNAEKLKQQLWERLGEDTIEQFLNFLRSRDRNKSDNTASGDVSSKNKSDNTASGDVSSENVLDKNTKTTDELSQRSNAAKNLKQKLKERLDECTRQQFCNYLMEIQEIKNFISFMAKEKTNPEEGQPKECSMSDDSDCRCRSCCD